MTDKYLIPLFVSGTILLVLFVFFIVTYLLVQKQKQNVYHLEKSRMIYNHQNKLLNVRIEEQERSMDQISREIHDNIGQLLNFAKMSLHPIARLATDEQQKTMIKSTSELVDQLILSVSNISHSLNTDYIKTKGLVTVLEEEIKFLGSHDILCRMEVTGNQTPLTPEKELFIYRIAQEAIHNIIKHSGASEVALCLAYDPSGDFSMSIRDNGKGFALSEIYELKGIGFLNMMNRAKLLNGTLDISSEPDNGSMIALRIGKDGQEIT